MSVKIFIAKDGDKYVTIDDAEKRKRYECIDCKGILIPKKGNKVRWHYAHHSGTVHCSGESWQHIFCKKFIVKNKDRITMISNCSTNGCDDGNIRLCLYNVIEEYAFGKYRFDCSVNLGNTIFGVIEIYHTHKTEDEKIKFIGENKFHFYEIKTEQIINLYMNDDKGPISLYSMHKMECIQCYNRRLLMEERERNERNERLENRMMGLEDSRLENEIRKYAVERSTHFNTCFGVDMRRVAGALAKGRVERDMRMRKSSADFKSKFYLKHAFHDN